MATHRDSEKIKIISLIKERARKIHESPYKLLANDDYFYEKAIKAQVNAGEMTLLCAIVGALVGVVTNFVFNANKPDTIIFVIVYISILLAILIPCSLKTSSLKTTSTAMLIMTIVQLVALLLFFSGITPLIAVVFNIIALIRWSTYRNWYDEISVEYYKGKKPKKQEQKEIKSVKDVYDFDSNDISEDDRYFETEQKPVGLIVSLVLAIIIGLIGCFACFSWGRNGGWIDGYKAGYNDGGNDIGAQKYDEGYDNGHNNGYSEGFGFGKNTGYNEGYNAGYRRAGCVTFGINCD